MNTISLPSEGLALDAFCEELNSCVPLAYQMPRVRFDSEAGEDAEGWLKRKHAGGQIHEPGTIAAFLAVARQFPDVSRVFDVGSLFGYFALLAYQLFDKADVTVFEMHPGGLQVLTRNLYTGMRIIPAAVSDGDTWKEETVWLSAFNIYQEPEGGWDKLADQPGAMKQRGAENRGRGFAKVTFTTIDHVVFTGHLNPDLMKIDVEGYQTKAIRGALKTLDRCRPIVIIELHDPEKTSRMHTTNAETVQPFFDLGYKAYWCGNFRASDARFYPVDKMGPEHERLSIMVFVPRERLNVGT